MDNASPIILKSTDDALIELDEAHFSFRSTILSKSINSIENDFILDFKTFLEIYSITVIQWECTKVTDLIDSPPTASDNSLKSSIQLLLTNTKNIVIDKMNLLGDKIITISLQLTNSNGIKSSVSKKFYFYGLPPQIILEEMFNVLFYSQSLPISLKFKYSDNIINFDES